MTKHCIIALLLAVAAVAQTQQEFAPAPIDYTNDNTWLCLPGHQDACNVNLDTTVIAADGSTTKEIFHPYPNAPIDCFYVYPTVSKDPGFNAPMTVEPEERHVVLNQFARFASVCRLYAPMYRQVTLAGLHARLTGIRMPGDITLGYRDVLGAWNEYLAHRNKGRGVVLIGHSQGSNVLIPLIAQEIDGKPVQSKLIAAILMGTSVQVPKGSDVGGSFKNTPLCHTRSQTGCIVTFSSYRADPPPPPNGHFAANQASTVAACVNPASLSGDSGQLKSYFPSGSGTLIDASSLPFGWTNPPKPLDTPFVSTPGLLSAECVATEHLNYLAITVHPTPDGHRANQIPGDLVISGTLLTDWGLHLIDVNLTMGNLLDIVKGQTKSYLAR
jgi:hypothetical protein